ncbi:MAG: protein kinase [Geminicoccaceae bacterium]
MAGAILPGTLLCNGTYRIDGRLGGGGMGEVYRGTNTVTGAPCAIKTIRPELLQDQFLRGLFVREAEALKSIRDGAVVGYEGVFRDEAGRVLIVMDFVDGPSLADRMRERLLTVDEVIRLARRLARGLAAAHAVGVHHRDLSPDNVLLPGGRLDDAVIIDFGIARREGGSGPTLYAGGSRGFTGKTSYASPEQAGAIDAPVDQRSDMFSLGLVLAAAARGRPLPMGDDPASAVAARMRRPDLSSLPKPLQQLIAPLLAPDPNDRPKSLEDFAGPTRSAPGPSATDRPSRVRWLAWIGAGAVAVALAAAVWVIVQEPTTAPPLSPPPPREIPSSGPSAPSFDQAALEAALADTPCAELSWTADGNGRVQLSGRIPSATAASGLVARVEAVPGVTGVENGTTLHPAPDCEAVHRIPAMIGMSDLAPPLISLNRPDGVYGGASDVFVATVQSQAATDLYVYVDYFHEDGSVYHLLPEPLATDNLVAAGGTIQVGHDEASAGQSDRVWRLSEPYGLGRVVALVSEQPLYDGVRTIGEPAEAYLAFLAEALPKAARTGRIAMSQVPIETRPER